MNMRIPFQLSKSLSSFNSVCSSQGFKVVSFVKFILNCLILFAIVK